MELDNVKIEVKDGIGTITVDREKALNALNPKTLAALKTAATAVGQDDSVKVVVVTGAGDKAFVAGADIKEMVTQTPLEARKFMQSGHDAFNALERLEKPVIAAVNGFALGGGCELAMACDIIIASEKAKFGLPEVGLGLHPGFGGTQRLPRLVGTAKAKELIFTGDMIGAEEALRIGLVNKVVPHDKLYEEVEGLAKKLMSKGLLAIKLAKGAIDRGSEVDLDMGLAYEIESVSLTFSTEDIREGMNAFMEKRKPEFKGK